LRGWCLGANVLDTTAAIGLGSAKGTKYTVLGALEWLGSKCFISTSELIPYQELHYNGYVRPCLRGWCRGVNDLDTMATIGLESARVP